MINHLSLFQRNLNLHDLPSFPTRRSSDLAMLGKYWSIFLLAGLGLAALADPRALQDRKSTRLNSSHQIISYAVFCLKKKKNLIMSNNPISLAMSTHHSPLSFLDILFIESM